MNRHHFTVLLGLMALLFSCQYITGASRESSIRESWKGIIPHYITDSLYYPPGDGYDTNKIQLGRYLFYDRRLSFNKTKSCSSCHDQQYSFTDNYRRSAGALGDLHQRNASPLINLIFRKYLTAADSGLHFPEQQINNPMFHQHPVELGWTGNEMTIMNRLRSDQIYTGRFRQAFPDAKDLITLKHIQEAIAAFVRSILSYNSPYDKYHYLGMETLSASQLRGMKLFFSETLACGKCHNGFDFATPSLGNSGYYFNTGLYNLYGKGEYPGYDQGLLEKTGKKEDMGVYRVPTLRNLAFTAPYYHDGSAANLETVIDNYAAGGRLILYGEFAGNGRSNPFKNPLISGFKLRKEEKKDLIDFLLALSDSSLLTNKSYDNPYKNDETASAPAN